jgi:chlorophyllide a reductase subunit Y
MKDFFGDTGEGDKSGVWQDVPQDRPEFREHTRRQVIKLIKRRKAEEMI